MRRAINTCGVVCTIIMSVQLPGAQGQGQAQGPGQGQQRQRVEVPQPQQKQSIDYFVGQWSYKYIGRESALWPAPRECVVTFTKRADGRSVEGVSECKHEGGAFKDSLVIVFERLRRRSASPKSSAAA